MIALSGIIHMYIEHMHAIYIPITRTATTTPRQKCAKFFFNVHRISKILRKVMKRTKVFESPFLMVNLTEFKELRIFSWNRDSVMINWAKFWLWKGTRVNLTSDTPLTIRHNLTLLSLLPRICFKTHTKIWNFW